MKRFALLLALFVAGPCFAQSITLDLVGTVSFDATQQGNGTSDVWGYVAPDGSEYAIVGVIDGTAIVSVPDLEVLHTIPGPTQNGFYYWRDMVVYGSTLYVVSELTGTNQGFQVIDLSGLPDTAPLITVLTDGGITSHNMDVDAVTGYAYVLSPSANGVRVFDLADPLDPQEIGFVETLSNHDIHARGDTLYVAEGSNGTFSIWDVADKQAPQLLARQVVPNAGYVHNIWPSDDGDYAVTTEETQSKTVKVWDISDLGDIELVGEYLGNNGLAHNAQVMGDLIVLSHYGAGVTVVDMSDPTDPVEVAEYDTTPSTDAGGFYGTWGAWPYSPNGYVYGSDFDGKLTVLQMNDNTVANESAAPATELMAEVYPNPSHANATLRFELAKAGPVRAVLYDVLGREVAVLTEGARPAGTHTVRVGDVPPGAYLVRIETPAGQRTLHVSRVR